MNDQQDIKLAQANAEIERLRGYCRESAWALGQLADIINAAPFSKDAIRYIAGKLNDAAKGMT